MLLVHTHQAFLDISDRVQPLNEAPDARLLHALSTLTHRCASRDTAVAHSGRLGRPAAPDRPRCAGHFGVGWHISQPAAGTAQHPPRQAQRCCNSLPSAPCHCTAGQHVLLRGAVDAFMAGQKITDLPGVGWRLEAKFQELGLATCSELQQVPLGELQARTHVFLPPVSVDRRSSGRRSAQRCTASAAASTSGRSRLACSHQKHTDQHCRRTRCASPCLSR